MYIIGIKTMKKVLLLLCKGVEIFEAAAFYDVLGWSGTDGSEQVDVVTVGLQSPVICTFGLTVIPDALLAEVQPDNFDALAVPGGFENFGFYEHAYSEEVSMLIRHFEEQKKPIASICVGALPLAKSGILSERAATTYQFMEGKRRKQLAEFNVNVLDELIVQDDNVITSTGPGTAVEVALRLLAELTGTENAKQIRHLMGFDLK
jgi:4-methyl-5(b-hydroxyethyl)-thiazole monophosphate biosynthesis